MLHNETRSIRIVLSAFQYEVISVLVLPSRPEGSLYQWILSPLSIGTRLALAKALRAKPAKHMGVRQSGDGSLQERLRKVVMRLHRADSQAIDKGRNTEAIGKNG
jgi:hypothetical protein